MLFRSPTLAELFALDPKVRLNIEIKTDPAKPDLTPTPEHFAALVVDVVRKASAARRTTIQSFDWRGLVAAKRLAPEIETSCLTIDRGGESTSVSRLASAKAAGCTIWSPFWRNLSTANLAEARALGLKVLPWTVNEPAEMARLIDLKVDGLITDYPDRALALLRGKSLK